MSMYYLHRDGETTGPFGAGRIAEMIRAAEISEHDLVCAFGTEEWIPAYMAAPTPSPPARPTLAPTAAITSGKRGVTSLLLFAVTILLLLAGYFAMRFGWLVIGLAGMAIGGVVFFVALVINHQEHTGN